MHEKRRLLRTAVYAAQRAADLIADAARPNPSTWDVKGASDFATQIDRDAEQRIAEAVLREYPDATVLGEELTPDGIHRGLVWVVDPLDGTTNFLHGYPAFGVSVAAVLDGAPAVGVVIDVARGLTYQASAGGGAWCGDQPLRVSQIHDPAFALVGTGFPFKRIDLLPQYLRQFDTILRSTSGIRRAGSAALDLVYVAAGIFDGFWELSLAPWDVAAGTLIAREAGAVVTDLAGDEDVIRQGPIVAGNPAMHRWLLDRLTD